MNTTLLSDVLLTKFRAKVDVGLTFTVEVAEFSVSMAKEKRELLTTVRLYL